MYAVAVTDPWSSAPAARRSRAARAHIVSDAEARPRPWRAAAAATAFNAPIGSLYAFTVLVHPLDTLLGLSRADLAFVFALVAAGFGAGMNVAPAFYRTASAPLLVLPTAAVSTLGMGSPPLRVDWRSWRSDMACCSAPAAARDTSSPSRP